jgi:hypothetical protein
MARVKSPLKVRLEAWNLRRVPFPAIPFVDPFNVDPLRNGSVFAPALRQAEIEAIRKDILCEGYASDLKVWNWVWARRNMGRNLGMGKTALLTYIADQINLDYGKTFFGQPMNWLAIYVPVQPKTRSLSEVAAIALASICNSVRGVSIEQLILARLRRKVLVLNLSGEQAAKMRATSERRFLDEKWLKENGIDVDLLAQNVEAHLLEQHLTPGSARSLANGALLAHLASVNNDPNIVPPKPRLAREAVNLLTNDFARAVNAAGIKQVTLLLDDFYYLVRNTNPGDRDDLVGELRGLAVTGGVAHFSVQQNLFSWIAVMHTQTAPTFRAAWEVRDMHLVAPLQFDAKTSVVLYPLPVNQGAAMLETYLASQRIKKTSDTAFPFTKDALDKIGQIAAEDATTMAGTYEPRSLLLMAHHVTSKALELNVPTPLGPQFVEHVLKGTPIQVATTGDDEGEEPNSEQTFGKDVHCPCGCHEDEEPGDVYDVVAIIEGGSGRVLGYTCRNCNKDIAATALVGLPVK